MDIEGEQVPLRVNWRAQAQRFILRLDVQSGGAKLTLPTNANLDDAIKFLKRHQRWLLNERRKMQIADDVGDEETIPLRGVPHKIIATGSGTRRVWTEPLTAADRFADEDDFEEGESGETAPAFKLMISGPADTATSRMVRWFKAEAKADLEASIAHHAPRLDVKPGRLSVRDQSSRWGSCSSTRALSFSWRLVMAPPAVLDYVAAHEVAHLREMNHSKRFWNLVEETYGDTGPPRAWLRVNGPSLHRYGR